MKDIDVTKYLTWITNYKRLLQFPSYIEYLKKGECSFELQRARDIKNGVVSIWGIDNCLTLFISLRGLEDLTQEELVKEVEAEYERLKKTLDK